MAFYAYSERARNAMNAKSQRTMQRSNVKRKHAEPKTTWPTIPCCDAMRAGLACDCCEIVDA